MQYLFIILLLVSALIISWISVRNNNFIIPAVLSLVTVIALSGFVTYTPDMEGYVYWIENDRGRDFFFERLVGFYKSIGYANYTFIHLTFITLTSILLVHLVNKFKVNTLYVILLFLPIIYIYYTTQIRFFLGFYSMCCAIYYFTHGHYKKMIVFGVFAMLAHISLLLFIPFFLFIRVRYKRMNRLVLYVGVSTVLVSYIASSLINFIGQDRFLGYLDEDSLSTFMGALFKFLPALINLCVIYILMQKRIKEVPATVNDKNFMLLYKLSVVPYSLLGLACVFQIVGSRFIVPAFLFQIILLIYLSKLEKSVKPNVWAFALLLLNMFLIYILPEYIFKVDRSMWEILKQTLMSNYLLNYFLL